MKKSHIAHDEVTIRMLRNDPDFAAEYLKAAMDDTEEPRVLLIALRRLAEAKGGLAKFEKKAEIEQASLSRALSPRGNPKFSLLAAIIKAMDLSLTVEASR